MKLSITIESDTLFEDFMACLPSIKSVCQVAQLNPAILEPDACGDLSLALCRPWSFDEDKPAPFGKAEITR